MATINDLVLVHIENKPAFFARINEINPDVKKSWYQVELLVLGYTSAKHSLDPGGNSFTG